MKLPLLAIGLMMAAPALAQQAPDNAPRAVVDRVADQIEAQYFDPALARRIADDLRQRAHSGTFDRMTDPFALSQSLTTILQAQDRHFRVNWRDPAKAAESGGIGFMPPDPELAARRTGYGFRKVEILPGNIGYVDLAGFSPIDWTDPNFPTRLAADSALSLIARTDAVIIDLRGNGGGHPTMVGYLASAFLAPDARPYNIFHSREGTESEGPQTPYAHPRPDVPLFILTSGRTASAAEAFAYTLQAAGRATIVGDTSMGAANPGGEVDAGGGYAIFISMGSPVNPITHGNWEGTGVVPQVKVTPDQALRDAQILALRAILPRVEAGQKRDTQWALDALTADPPAALDTAAYAGSFGDWKVVPETGRLSLRIGRRPPRILLPIGPDLFTVENSPGLRYHFVRDGQNRITALEFTDSDGFLNRQMKDGAD